MLTSSSKLSRVALCAAILSAFACSGGDDDVDHTDAHAHAVDASSVDAGPTVDGSTTTVDGSTKPAAPVISKVTWKQVSACAKNKLSDVTVTVDVTDADTTADKLTFSIGISGCSGDKTTNPAVLKCPQAAPYPGTATVTDPDKGTDEQKFTVSPCVDGTAP
jgi:hypothetical protein